MKNKNIKDSISVEVDVLAWEVQTFRSHHLTELKFYHDIISGKKEIKKGFKKQDVLRHVKRRINTYESRREELLKRLSKAIDGELNFENR